MLDSSRVLKLANSKRGKKKMSSKDGGSGVQGGAAAPSPIDNKVAKISVDQALAENEALKRELQGKDGTIAELTQQLKAANDVLEAQAKAKLIGEILPRSSSQSKT